VSAPRRAPVYRDRRRLYGAAAIVLVVAVALLAWQRPNPFAKHEKVRVAFTDVGGLGEVGADVRIAGTPVGKVTERERVGDHAELVLELDPSAGPVHRDASAELRPRLMFEGSGFVDLHPGSARSPELDDGVLPLSRTRVYTPLTEALGILRARSRENLSSLAGSTRALLSAHTPDDVNHVLRGAPELVRTIGPVARAARGSHRRELRQAIGDLSDAAHSVAARASDLPPLESSAAATTEALATGGGAELDATLARLPASADSVRSGAVSLHAVLDSLRPRAVELRPGAAALRPALAELRPVLRVAAPAVTAAPPLIADFRTVLDSVPGAAPPLRAVVRAIAPTLKIARGTLIPALLKPTSLGTPAYLAFLGLFAGGGGASRPFGVQGDGHFMRFGLRFLTGAGQPLPRCSDLESLNAQLASVLSASGGCTP
jgi:phospholipid/cholesterol/gamma-HCH transport system substrate-binding protein